MGGCDCQSIPGTIIPNPLWGLQSQLAIILCGIHPIIKSSNQILPTSAPSSHSLVTPPTAHFSKNMFPLLWRLILVSNLKFITSIIHVPITLGPPNVDKWNESVNQFPAIQKSRIKSPLTLGGAAGAVVRCRGPSTSGSGRLKKQEQLSKSKSGVKKLKITPKRLRTVGLWQYKDHP